MRSGPSGQRGVMRTIDPNAYGSSWYSATRVASPPRGRLVAELDVDVCVIGGGLAGLTVAREVALRGWSVVVLEAESVAWNASGRNVGFVMPGYAASADALVARVGLDRAKALWALSEAGVEYVRNTIRDTAMPDVAPSEGGWLHVSKTSGDGAIRAADLLAGQFGAEVEAWPAERVRDELRSPLYFGALHHPRAFSIHTLNYALGLAAAAEASGARICEQSAALEIDPGGVRKRVVTKDARVRAAHVVLAGNVHLKNLTPQFAGTLLPVHTYVITTAPLGGALREAIRYPGAVSDTDVADNYYRVVDGDRLMWSGRSTTWRGKPRRYVETLIGDIARVYPQLGRVRAEYAWTGTLGFTVHRMPQIGEISPGLWMLSGFGGHGLNTSAMGGEIVARAIVEGDRTWQQFSPYELVWAGGPFGRAAQQVFYRSFRARELFDGWLARRREALSRPAAEPHTVEPQTLEPQAAKPQAAAALPETAALPATPSGEPPSEPAPVKRKRRRRKKRAVAVAQDAVPTSGEVA